MPHVVEPRTDAGPRSTRRSWLLGLGVSGTVALLTVVLVVVLLPADDATDGAPNQAGAPDHSSEVATAAPTEDTEETVPPAHVVPCDNAPYRSCYPKDEITGPELLDRITETLGWSCYKRGETDADGDEVAHYAGICSAANNVDQPYGIEVSIGYQGATQNDTEWVGGVKVGASLSAYLDQGQDITEDDVAAALADVVEIALDVLWPERSSVREEMLETFRAVDQQCRVGDTDQPSQRTSTGHKLWCFPYGGTIILETVKVMAQSFYFDAPIT